jgi:hypothetical protein
MKISYDSGCYPGRMSSFYSSNVASFLEEQNEIVFAALHSGYARTGHTTLFSEQTLTWEADLQSLRSILTQLVSKRQEANAWTLIFEYSIPRREKRIDIVLLTKTLIVLVECKRALATTDARRQVEEYALLLHYFHQPSQRRRIYPVVVAAKVNLLRSGVEDSISRQRELGFDSLPTFWISPVRSLLWEQIADALFLLEERAETAIDTDDWLNGRYFPVPTIVEAARDLRNGLKLREIAHSEASEHEITLVTDTIHGFVNEAEALQQHVICFLTGVPGSGKTLVGLSLAHLGEKREDAIHFMSGNGPLVEVLQENFRRQAMRDRVPAAEASLQAKTLIEMVHVFARTYMERDTERPPSNHVVIFDEAQRAWNKKQNMAKFNRPFSEPEMLLGLMARHVDWSVVIALVGGGQEINSGEAGLEEWGRAIANSPKPWRVIASHEVLEGGPSTAGRRLFPPDVNSSNVETNPYLHLRTSNRSLRTDSLASWVNAILDSDIAKAQSLRITEKYPIFLTRSLQQAKQWLTDQSLAESRFGLVGSSGAQRLRGEGLEPSSSFHAEYPWHHWYLSPRTDVRSCYQCEVFATEFEVQGLELDWVGLCWGGDYIRSENEWLGRDLRTGSATTRWGTIKNDERKAYRKNAYRVLLTRARQGMILFVPAGDVRDSTRSPQEFDLVANYLVRCGVIALP